MATNRCNTHDEVPFKVTDPERIPAPRYYDAEFFALENERLWMHVWQMACRLEEIPEVGDYVEYTILDKSVIVVRTAKGIKAFHNACRHRGVRLVTGPGNCVKQGFVCPFHGWRWNSEGENTFVFGRQIFSPENLEQAEINLRSCRVELWAGCAFVNFDDDAPGLIDSLGPIADRLNAAHADKLKMDWWYATVLPTNWKLAVEAFQEDYHVMKTHPQLHALATDNSMSYGGTAPLASRKLSSKEMVDANIAFLTSVGEGMAGLVHHTELAVLEQLRDVELPDDPTEAIMTFYGMANEAIRQDGLARGAPMFDINKVRQEYPHHGVEFIFPNFFLLPVFAAMSSYRVRPLTEETCLFEIWSLVLRPEDEEYDTPRAPTILPHDSQEFPEIPRQDYSNLPRQQLGLHAAGFEYMRLSKDYEGMISNFERLVDGFLARVDGKKLAKAQNIVNCGFNSPIHDLGF